MFLLSRNVWLVSKEKKILIVVAYRDYKIALKYYFKFHSIIMGDWQTDKPTNRSTERQTDRRRTDGHIGKVHLQYEALENYNFHENFFYVKHGQNFINQVFFTKYLEKI